MEVTGRPAPALGRRAAPPCASLPSVASANGQRPTANGIKAVAFDLDSTLVDFLSMKRAAVRAAARAMVDRGLPLPLDRAYRRLLATYFEVGIESDRAFTVFLERTMGRADRTTVDAGVRAYLRTKEEVLQTYPGAHETLGALKAAGLRLGVVTDAPRDKAIVRLSITKLGPYFDTILALEDSPRGKRDVRPFLLLCDRLGLSPREVLFVGDNPLRDVSVASRLGMATALAAYGMQDHGEWAHRKVRPTFVLETLPDLLSAVQGLRNGTVRLRHTQSRLSDAPGS
ncbi:MAG: HAD family hydrolase [Methanobacteriota archaeon]